MDEKNNVSICIELSTGKISMLGPDVFIEKNMAQVFSFVEHNIGAITQVVSALPVSKDLTTANIVTDDYAGLAEEQHEKEAEVDKYIQAGAYHISDDGEISILGKIPGNSKAEKMKNIALIVLHIRRDKIDNKEIIPICEKHSCYDSSNFSAVFKSEKTNIIRRGKGHSWTLELTQPGEEAAIAVLEEMISGKK